MLRHVLLLMAVPCLAIAAPEPISPSMKVPGLSAARLKDALAVAMNVFGAAFAKQGQDPRQWTKAERECAAAQFLRVAAQAGLLFEELAAGKMEGAAGPAELEGMRQAVEYLKKLERDWCNGQGGNTPKVHLFMTKWREENLGGSARTALQRRVDSLGTSAVKPDDVALVLTLMMAAAALELLPVAP